MGKKYMDLYLTCISVNLNPLHILLMYLSTPACLFQSPHFSLHLLIYLFNLSRNDKCVNCPLANNKSETPIISGLCGIMLWHAVASEPLGNQGSTCLVITVKPPVPSFRPSTPTQHQLNESAIDFLQRHRARSHAHAHVVHQVLMNIDANLITPRMHERQQKHLPQVKERKRERERKRLQLSSLGISPIASMQAFQGRELKGNKNERSTH